MSEYVDNIIKEHFTTSKPTPQQAPINNPTKFCSTAKDCAGNDSKRKCYFKKCVECHANNQCVDPSKLRCNTQTFECENGHYIGAYLTKELAKYKIEGDMDVNIQKIADIQLGNIPDLFINTRKERFI